MNSNLQTSKSILAKLLATENITVSHQSVKTAYFDLKNRTMVLPVWKDMDGDLYDLLTGHEVGHALNTPEQGWHDAVKQGDSKKFKDFLNVIEDARIEKLIKRKFPGLSKSFARAYASLYERDFFGIKQLDDLNKLNLIDRINLRFKMGAHVVVEFSDAEREIVREIEAAETWDQVYDIARRVYDYVKENEQDKIQNGSDLREEMQMQSQQDFVEQDSDDFEDIDNDDDYQDDIDGDDDADADDSDSDDVKSTEEDEDSENEESSTNNNGSDADEEDSDEQVDDEPHSVTDQNFRRREQELVNETGRVYMYNLPDVDLSKIILPNNEVFNDLEKHIRAQVASENTMYGRNGVSYDAVVQKCVRKFNTNNKKVIMHILKEFEMRKKASEYARAQTARTGELNMNVLHKYRFSNDLFRKITVVPKGKNHGFVLFVDMSGSMAHIMRNTIDQLLILVSFCKLAKVPCEVYGFSDDYHYNNYLDSMLISNERFISDSKTELSVNRSSFHLKHLIGSSLSPIQYRRAFNLLCVVANEYGRRYTRYDEQHLDPDHGDFDASWEPGGFGLNGTPFIQTLLSSRDIITQFQSKHQLDVCNVVYLTDGEGGSDISYPSMESNDEWTARRKSVIYLVDKKSKKKVKMKDYNDFQASITRLVTDVTGCKHIGFYVGERRWIQRDMKYYIGDKSFEEQNAAKKTFREQNYYITDRAGYDKYFFVALPSTNVKDENLAITNDMSKHKMVKAFSKNVEGKRTSRLLLTKLAEELAVA